MIVLSPNNEAILTKMLQYIGASEWCGYLAQTSDGIQRLLALRNKRCSGGFWITQAERIRVFKYTEAENLRIEAFVHSHPAPNLDLSAEDMIEFVSDTLPWMIVALVDGRLQWRVHEQLQ